MSSIVVFTLEPATEPQILGPLCMALRQTFRLRVDSRPPSFSPDIAFDAARNQYNSRIVLAQLLQEPVEEGDKVLGVASGDLFIPVLTYVFGEAQLEGRAAVISTHRLRSELYGLAPNKPQLLERTIKEAVHELGHTYGLLHCENQDCVMWASTYVEEIDLKSAGFCPKCQTAIK